MNIVSVNVSDIKEFQHNDKTIRTGIFKKPATGTLTLTATGISGDAQADLVNHGGLDKAVYGFSANHYHHWQNYLGTTLNHGAFGENLTVANLPEDDIYIGDEFRLGSCVIQVSQPRVPCFKLGIALGNKAAVKEFIRYGHTGVYFRVLQAGSFTPSDCLVKIQPANNSVSVKELFHAKFEPGFKDQARIFATARGLKSLSTEWQEKVK